MDISVRCRPRQRCETKSIDLIAELAFGTPNVHVTEHNVKTKFSI
jgi:hypothetical protein